MNPISRVIQTKWPFVVRLIRSNHIVLATISQDCASSPSFFCPFRRRTRTLGTLQHRRIPPGSWRPSKRALLFAYMKCSPWLGHSTCACIEHKLPCYRHGLIRKLLLSHSQLNILFPGVPLAHWRTRFDLVFRLWIYSLLFCGIRIFIFSFIVSHHN